MSGYVLARDADLDLDSIWEYIAEDDIDAADRWIEKLFEAFEKLAQTPGIGHKRDDLTEYPLLFWPVGAYLIIYRAGSSPIEIVAVTQGARDIPALCLQMLPHLPIDSRGARCGHDAPICRRWKYYGWLRTFLRFQFEAKLLFERCENCRSYRFDRQLAAGWANVWARRRLNPVAKDCVSRELRQFRERSAELA